MSLLITNLSNAEQLLGVSPTSFGDLQNPNDCFAPTHDPKRSDSQDALVAWQRDMASTIAQQPPESPESLGDAPQAGRRTPPPHRRRDKVQLSCNLCRRRKLKCDRNRPCGTCTSRGYPSACEFPGIGNSRPRPPRPTTNKSVSITELHGRIRQLEDVVASYMSGSGGVTKPAVLSNQGIGAPDSSPASHRDLDDQQTELDSPATGHIRVGDEETTYVGSTHWGSILQELDEVTEALAQEKFLSEAEETDSYLLLGMRSQLHEESLLASIPSKDVADRLVSVFFEVTDLAPMILHEPTFKKEYEQFWRTPKAASKTWVAVLYGMLALAMKYIISTTSEAPALAYPPDVMTSIFREEASKCLIYANYTKPTTYTVEAMMLHFISEMTSEQHIKFTLRLILSSTIQVAMRMGYHGDASHYRGISVFRGEMRRRIWALIRFFDVLIASQTGLPRNIRDDQTDAKPPRAFPDDDMDEFSKELPPERVNSQSIRLYYSITRVEPALCLGRIEDKVNSLKPTQYEDIMQLDQHLREVYAGLPADLQPGSTLHFHTLTAPHTRGHGAIELFYHRSRCVLHRQYVIIALSNPRYTYSRKTAIDASLQLLHMQEIFAKEARQGGRFHRDSWKATFVIVHTFFLAGMILCVDLDHSWGAVGNDANSNEYYPEGWTQQKVFDALKRSRAIWKGMTSKSKICGLAYKALGAMLAKIQKAQSDSAAAAMPAPEHSSYSYNVTADPNVVGVDSSLAPTHTTAALATTHNILAMDGTNLTLSDPSIPMTDPEAAFLNLDTMSATTATAAPAPTLGPAAALFSAGAPSSSPEDILGQDFASFIPETGAGGGGNAFAGGVGDAADSNIDWSLWDSQIQGHCMDFDQSMWDFEY